jgi:hypothetical protein
MPKLGNNNNIIDYNVGNCDKDKYTSKLSISLLKSFRYMVDIADNSYIGIWHNNSNNSNSNSNFINFWQSLVTKKIKIVKYHTIILDNNDNSKKDKITLYKTIRESNLKKLVVCNPLLIKAKILFKINHMITVPFNNWFDTQFDDLLQYCTKIMSDNSDNSNSDAQFIVITCCGMSAKVLIAELSKLFPNNIYLDFGSALDKICTKKTSRGWESSYEELMNDLKDIIPDNWNNPKYDYIYTEAQDKLGKHITPPLLQN